MKKHIRKVFTFLMTLAVSLSMVGVRSVTADHNDIDKINSNYREYLLGNETINNDAVNQKKITAIYTNGKKAMESIVGHDDEYITGLVLRGGGKTDHDLSTNLQKSYQQLNAIALAYSMPGNENPLYQSPEALKAVLDGIKWLGDNYFNKMDTGYYGNWYSWEIGVPQSLSNIMFLLGDEIEAALPRFINESVIAMDSYIRGDAKPGDPTIGDVNLDARQHTGANLTDITFNRILQGAVLKDEARISKAVENSMTVFSTIDPSNLQHGVTDGFYEDGSFVQHSTVAYTGSYGKVLLGRIAQLVTVLDGTKWQNDTLLDTVQEWIYRGFAPVMYEGYMMEIVKGRAVSRTGSGYGDASSVIEAFVQLSQSLPQAEQLKLQSYIKYLIENIRSTINPATFVSIQNIAAYEAIVKNSEIKALNPLETNDHYAFNLMDKAIHTREGFAFALSRSSNRISKYEYMSGENLRSWFQGDGAYYLYQSGNDQTSMHGINFYATVDQHKLPGITTVNEVRQTIPELYGKDFYDRAEGFEAGSITQNKYVYFPLGTNDYSGDVKMGIYGASAMQLGDDEAYADAQAGLLPEDFKVYKNAEANKSWFMFDEEIVALGSNIHDEKQRDLTTTVENRMFETTDTINLKGENQEGVKDLENGVQKGLKWLAMGTDGVNKDTGYVFFGNQDVNVNTSSNTQKYSYVRNKTVGGADKEVTRQFATVTYEHDGKETSQYAYAILPNASADETEAYAKANPIEIVAQEDGVHAVRQKDLGMTGYAFFDEADHTVEDLSTNSKMIVMRKGLNFAVQDPTHKQATVSFTLDGTFDVVSGNGDAVIENGKTHITVNTENKNGVSQNLQLEAVTVITPEKPEVKPETPKTLTLVDDASNVVITYTEGDLPENTSLSVSINNNLSVDGLKNTVGYDITLLSDGHAVQPKNPVNVSIEPKKSLDRGSLQVYHETKDGFESLAWVEDGTRITFDTASFSLFVLGEKDVKVLPSTGVTPQNVLPFVGVLVVVGGCFVLYGKRKNKK